VEVLMRHVALAALAALAGCNPDIASGSYLCGPEGLCPEGQVCNGPDNRCVLPGEAQAFACGAAFDPSGDDAPATGTEVQDLTCSSVSTSTDGCLGGADERDFFQLDVPAECAASRIEASVSFPIAFQPVRLLLSVGGAAPEQVETPCPPSLSPAEGHGLSCFSQAALAGQHYAIGVIRAGDADCGGACRHNRYALRFRLASP
jgi:hypothetical protein